MPSERLADLARKHDLSYRKTIEGPQALGQVDADVVADDVRTFRSFATRCGCKSAGRIEKPSTYVFLVTSTGYPVISRISSYSGLSRSYIFL